MSVLLLVAPLAAFAAGGAPIADHGGMPFAIGVKFIPATNRASSRWSSVRVQHDEHCFFRTLRPSGAPPTALNLASPPFDEWSLSAPLQVLISDRPNFRSAEGLVCNEPPAAEEMPEIAVEASAPGPLPSATNTRCGIAGIARSFVHPADAWREVAPLPAASDTDACLRSEAVVEHVPEALASVRWYQ